MKDREKIDNFPNYEITRDGKVYNKDGKLLKQEETRKGYLRVSLNNETLKRKRESVHRLVAETFIPNPNNYSQVDHINENKKDNRVENLRWVTPLENLNHSGVIEKASIAKFRKVECITTGEVFNSVKEAEEKYNLSHSNIIACCNRRRKTCGGFRWKYIEEE